MSHGYKAVGWNRQKKQYDRWLAIGVGLYLAAFIATTLITHPQATAETVLIRAFATCALLLLHLVLCIGPLCRLDPRFLPLLYNRRHLGVTLFLLAAAHGVFALIQHHALGNRNPLVSLLTSNTRFGSIAQFPFELFGLLALAILFLMAATSHDFWLANLTAPVWKALHLGVYAAYASLVLHVALGVLQAETSPLYAGVLAVGFSLVLALHLAAALRGKRLDRELPGGEFVDVCAVADIPEKRARVACISGERVAVFKYDGKVSAISSVCQHQNGPLGEGCIIGGLVTCPWHGYQYRPEDGASPAPFTEKVPTFRVRLVGGRVQVDPRPLPAGTRVEPAVIAEATDAAAAGGAPFYVGYHGVMPPALAAFLRPRVAALLLFAPALGAALAVPQHPFGPGVFEFGHLRTFEGAIIPGANPTLLAVRPDDTGGLSRHFLCAPGKHGAADLFRPSAVPYRVRLNGTLIERDGRRMIEVVPKSIEMIGGAAVSGAAQDLGPFTLRGEIVDSKCFLGVMKPGQLKTHKACAIRCISGGIPPVLLVRDGDGRALYLLLEGADGRAVNEEVIPYVAEPIEVQGRVERRDDLLVLQAEPATFRRL